jgi:DNA-binding response OmpR family regulator
MDGIEATKRIRQLEQESGRPPIAIVGYTASVEQSALRRAEEAGMDMILSKPCSIPKLRALIETILLAQDMANADPTGTATQCTNNSDGDGGFYSDQHGMSRPTIRMNHHGGALHVELY